MSRAAHRHQALFALHHTPAPDERERASPWLQALARVPPGPERAALAELVEIIQRYPVRVWGRMDPGGAWVLGITAEQSWKRKHPETFEQALAAWRRSLGVLVRWCWELLEEGEHAERPTPAGPS